MPDITPCLLSGNEAVALAALHAGICLGSGYPGTPSTEILESLAERGGKAQWSPNEKVALEVGIGVSFGGGRSLVTMKHVGLNVAADPLFTVAYAGIKAALVLVVCDDPGMASSQNEQDSRHYARAAGLPMLEPSDSQEAYDLTLAAVGLSEQFRLPVLLRLTTRISHSKSLVAAAAKTPPPPPPRGFKPDIKAQVMIPAHARPAHRRLREKLQCVLDYAERTAANEIIEGTDGRGIITSGAAYQHVREACPNSAVLKLTVTHPLPTELVRSFAAKFGSCWVIEEGDPIFYQELRAAGVPVSGKGAEFRFGELNVSRVKNIVENGQSAQPPGVPGKPPELCQGCPHRKTFETLKKLDCIVAGDIGCYTLGALPPLEALHIQLCMGSSIGIGAGLRHALGAEAGKRVVSVIGDSTFFHSGITGLLDSMYNPPPGGHVILVLDNRTTAMTGLQDHPGTGRTLNGEAGAPAAIEDIARAAGIEQVFVVDPVAQPSALEERLHLAMGSGKVSVIVVRRACLLAIKRNKELENACA